MWPNTPRRIISYKCRVKKLDIIYCNSQKWAPFPYSSRDETKQRKELNKPTINNQE